jgi:hypothetical protein
VCGSSAGAQRLCEPVAVVYFVQVINIFSVNILSVPILWAPSTPFESKHEKRQTLFADHISTEGVEMMEIAPLLKNAVCVIGGGLYRLGGWVVVHMVQILVNHRMSQYVKRAEALNGSASVALEEESAGTVTSLGLSSLPLAWPAPIAARHGFR